MCSHYQTDAKETINELAVSSGFNICVDVTVEIYCVTLEIYVLGQLHNTTASSNLERPTALVAKLFPILSCWPPLARAGSIRGTI